MVPKEGARICDACVAFVTAHVAQDWQRTKKFKVR